MNSSIFPREEYLDNNDFHWMHRIRIHYVFHVVNYRHTFVILIPYELIYLSVIKYKKNLVKTLGAYCSRYHNTQKHPNQQKLEEGTQTVYFTYNIPKICITFHKEIGFSLQEVLMDIAMTLVKSSEQI